MHSNRLRTTSFRKAAGRNWLEDGDGVTLFIGVNGAGKSRLLAEIATDARQENAPTILIANTIYDRFRQTGPSIKRMVVRYSH